MRSSAMLNRGLAVAHRRLAAPPTSVFCTFSSADGDNRRSAGAFQDCRCHAFLRRIQRGTVVVRSSISGRLLNNASASHSILAFVCDGATTLLAAQSAMIYQYEHRRAGAKVPPIQRMLVQPCAAIQRLGYRQVRRRYCRQDCVRAS
ncbi:hypothetical protein IQ06DRAFT_31714 [Phaeosphaeriaceae sp. SRC1lsM3a]|nr:hypothetical protein IQ06DRAFT_31714 [Stagonospora sp. SRC1lsM3a]